ncbi:hypothetical protein [Novosphingobium sp. KN65.2]|uniref:hypothetical protein n=1 Tax=Novosphingobium sp. KN65.2 TaxID=1478134 RepID=UPI0005DBF8B7|nr:hypothetical protein [Novosphingobium sp. KN65.2]CDO37860.1 conserved membrane hypothetical protein [Novosphingobium sp. KN65.2]
MPKLYLAWWFWLAMDLALVNYLFIDRDFVKGLIALAAIQVPVFAMVGQGLRSFPAQVRMAYLALLIMGLFPSFAYVHWMQLVGTTAMILFDYCFLARCLSLLPFNRTEPLTGRLVVRTFLCPPVSGSIMAERNAYGPRA